MKKVLLIGTNQERLPDPIPPLGLAYVAAATRERGHVTSVFDACFSKSVAAELADRVKTFRPDVIGVSIRNVDNIAFPSVKCYLEDYRKIVAVCRTHAPRAVIVAGGSAFSLFPEEFMEKLDVDHGVIGEGEVVFADLVDQLDRSGKVGGPLSDARGIIRPRADPGIYPDVRPALDLLDLSRYHSEGGSINIQTRRGCVFKCIYCTYPLLEGDRIRAREPRAVVDEMEWARREHGIESFFFVDNVFNHPADYTRALCGEIIRRRLGVRWTAYVTPAGCPRELLALMQESGCHSIDLGTDSFSDGQLRRMGKSFGSKHLFAVTAACRELGIRFSHSLIFGGPGESWETVEETVDNVVRSGPNAVVAIVGVRLYRNTAMADHVVARGLIAREEIGVAPVFFISEEVRHGILDYLGEVASRYKNWIVPGLGKNMNERFFKRVRGRGVKGPLWELFDPVEYGEIPRPRNLEASGEDEECDPEAAEVIG